MASTLATEKQTDAIKQRMQQIRSELPYDVDVARERVRELSDWRYHLSQRPAPILAVAFAAGYLLVPRKHGSENVIVHREYAGAPQEPAKRGMLGGIAGAVATIALKQVSVFAAQQVSRFFAKDKYPV